jgi:hypothetical protein
MTRLLFLALVTSVLPSACGGTASPTSTPTDDASSDAYVDGSADGFPNGPDASSDAQGGWDGALGFTCSGATPTFSKDVHPIFVKSCGGELCHGGLAPGAWPYVQLVNAKVARDLCNPSAVIVSPSSLEKSYLMNKLTGLGVCPGTSQMPKTGMPLPSNEIQTIADWICAGAPND